MIKTCSNLFILLWNCSNEELERLREEMKKQEERAVQKALDDASAKHSQELEDALNAEKSKAAAEIHELQQKLNEAQKRVEELEKALSDKVPAELHNLKGWSEIYFSFNACCRSLTRKSG